MDPFVYPIEYKQTNRRNTEITFFIQMTRYPNCNKCYSYGESQTAVVKLGTMENNTDIC